MVSVSFDSYKNSNNNCYVKRMMYKLEDEIEDEVEVVAISRQWILFI